MKPTVIKQNSGCDFSKDDFKVSFQQLLSTHKKRIKGSRTFKNTLTGFKAFVQWVEKRWDPSVQLRITLEATGVYYEQFVHFLNDHTDYRISVVLPNQSKAYFKSLNIKSKTDKIDAKVLGLMGLERELQQWQPLSDNIRLLKQLTRERTTLLEQKTALLNRLHALKHSYQPNKEVVKRIQQQVKLVQKQLKQIQTQIQKAVNEDEFIKQRIDKICKVKGLGLITVVTLIAETAGFDLFTSRAQLISYAGYDVVENQSGSSINGKTKISKKGNKHIRRALHFPAMVVVKYDPRFTQLYDRIYDRTKIKKKGLVAVQRKLLLLCYSLFKKNQAYDPNYLKNSTTEEAKEITIQICRQDTIPAYGG